MNQSNLAAQPSPTLRVLPDLKDHKLCSVCKTLKSLSEFYPDKRISSGLRYECRSCTTATTMRWRNRNPKKYKNAKLKREYDITIGQYEELLTKQKGICAICGNPPSTKRPLSVDHCHTTKKIRGLLCQKCNSALGFLRDNPKLLRIAAVYLELQDGDK